MGVIITTAGEKLMARLQAEGKPLVIDTFIFAEIPGQDYEADIDPGMALPAESRIRLRYPIPEEYRAYVNPNQVVYSALLGSDVGDWVFNWQGLYCSEHKTLVAVATFPAIEKRAYSADTGQPGNNLTRNFILEFNGAQKLTQINVSADVWQLDFTVRLAGMDERERLSNYDLYGQGYFDGDGWKLVKQAGGYAFQPGLGYVGGIRAALVSSLPVPALSKKPCDVWLSVCLKPQGSDRVAEATPLWVDPGASVADVRDDAGIMHYRARVARVDASGNVTDIRPPEFGDADQPGHIETYLKDNRRYATCATAAATVAKTAALPGFILKPGAWAVVRFSNTNTAAGATLNIGGTGAKPIQYHGKALTAGTPGAGRAYAFIYTGSAYELVGDVLTLVEGGGLSFDAKGHLYVDFSLVPDDQMRAIVLAMVQEGSGLAVDGKGKLYVDFASMPTDKFESMLKSIRVPIWLSKNLAFYVDASTGADTLDDGRGLSVSKPFKTIRAAVEYIANNYNLGKYIATVYIGAGIYGEDINLPKYNSTTGYIYLRGIDEDRGQVVINGCIYAGTSVGVYYFRSVTVRNRAGESSIGSKNFFAVSARPGAELQLYNLGIDLSSAAPSLGDKYGIVAMGGTITIRDLNEDDIGLSISSGSAAIAQALRGTEGGKIFMLADISISGAVGATLALSGLAIFDVQNMVERDAPKFVGYVTGRRYSVNENSIAKTHGRGPDFIPGDSAGLIDTGGQYS